MVSVVEGQAGRGGPGLPARATPLSLRLPCILDEARRSSSLDKFLPSLLHLSGTPLGNGHPDPQGRIFLFLEQQTQSPEWQN